MQLMLPVFFGLAGPALTAAETAFFQAARPAGYILFKRNVVDAGQVRALTDSLRALSGDAHLPILIDQEGGRVQRLGPPVWPAYPPARVFGELWAKAPLTAMAALRANAQSLGVLLAGLGISVDCLPLVDVGAPGMHDVIGDRSFGTDASMVAALGRATLDGLRAGGTVGVIKHIPGHGRARADSHRELPVVEASAAELARDIAPFRALADAPMAMTAHIRYPAWDSDLCASQSPTIIHDIIRGECGFANLLLSDDLGMQALASQPGGASMAGRASAVLAAGCDIALHCSGDLGEMQDIAAAVPAMPAESAERLARAMAWPAPVAGDATELAATRDTLLASA